MKNFAAIGLSMVCSLVSVAAQAQELKAFSVHPLRVNPGVAVTLTARFDLSAGLNCAVRVHFGDGQTQDVQIKQKEDATYQLDHSYEQPGVYTVRVEPTTVLPSMKCLGDDQRVVITVLVPPPAPAAPVKPA